ncbi:MAG: amidinotransferase [Caldilineaceae bacterium]|nr:amidinotransferase [Caldilineaceae bacterium]
MNIGSQSMVAPLRTVLVKDPRASHVDQATVDAQWQTLHYPDRPDLARVQAEYAAFFATLADFDLEIGTLPPAPETTLDSIYTHDPVAAVSRRGVILGNMGKAARRTEPDAMETYLRATGVPILGRIQAPGQVEGGDVCWLDARTVAVGEGYRTNAEGIRQLRALLDDDVDEVIPVPLPHWTGPDDCLHLLSFISPVDHDKAVVYSRMMPVPFRQLLLDRGVQLIEVPDEEYDSFACNVLAVAPGVCIMLEGNPVTQARLEAAGVAVHTFPGQDLCIKGGGGPTCLTRPLWRQV